MEVGDVVKVSYATRWTPARMEKGVIENILNLGDAVQIRVMWTRMVKYIGKTEPVDVVEHADDYWPMESVHLVEHPERIRNRLLREALLKESAKIKEVNQCQR